MPHVSIVCRPKYEGIWLGCIAVVLYSETAVLILSTVIR